MADEDLEINIDFNVSSADSAADAIKRVRERLEEFGYTILRTTQNDDANTASVRALKDGYDAYNVSLRQSKDELAQWNASATRAIDVMKQQKLAAEQYAKAMDDATRSTARMSAAYAAGAAATPSAAPPGLPGTLGSQGYFSNAGSPADRFPSLGTTTVFGPQGYTGGIVPLSSEAMRNMAAQLRSSAGIQLIERDLARNQALSIAQEQAIAFDRQRTQGLRQGNQLATVGAAFGSGQFGSIFGGMGAAQLVQSSTGLTGGAALAAGFGIGAAVTGAQKLVGFLEEGVAAAIKFEPAMARIGAAAGFSAEKTEALRSHILDLSSSFGTDKADVAAGAYKVLTSGIVSAADAMTVLDAAQKTAFVTGEQTTQVAQSLTAVIGAFGLNAQDAARIAAELWQASKNTGVSFAVMSEELGRAATNARAVGVDFHEVLALVEALKKTGVTTSEAFQGTSKFFDILITSGPKIKELMGGLSGETFISVHGGLLGALDALNEAAKKSPEAFGEALSGIRNLKGAMIEAAANTDQMRESINKLPSAVGEFGKAVDDLNANQGIKIQKLGTAWDNLKEKIAAGALSMADDFAKAVSQIPASLNPGYFDKTESPADREARVDAEIARGNSAPSSIYGGDMGKSLTSQLKEMESDNELLKNLFGQEEQIWLDANKKRDSAFSTEIEALKKHNGQYIEEIQKRVEKIKLLTFEEHENFEKSAFQRKLDRGFDENGRRIGTRQRSDLLEDRIKGIVGREEGLVGGFEGLSGQALLDSKAPEEVRRLFAETMKLREEQLHDAEKTGSRRKVLSAEEELEKEEKRQEEFMRRLSAHGDDRVKHAKTLTDQQAKDSATETAIDDIRKKALADVAKGGNPQEVWAKALEDMRKLTANGDVRGKTEGFSSLAALELNTEELKKLNGNIQMFGHMPIASTPKYSGTFGMGYHVKPPVGDAVSSPGVSYEHSGPINVTVHGIETPQQAGMEVVNAVKKAIRRGIIGPDELAAGAESARSRVNVSGVDRENYGPD